MRKEKRYHCFSDTDNNSTLLHNITVRFASFYLHSSKDARVEVVKTTPSITNLAAGDGDADDEAEDKLPTDIVSVSDDDAAAPPEFSKDSTRG